MNIPFSTDSNFSREFKTALGFVDIDIPYIKIQSDLYQASLYLIDIIGQTTYNALIANYKLKPEGTEYATEPFQNIPLNQLFQYAVAIKAYSLFAPSTDLAHTANGRRMRSSEDEKTPFEWMIAKDDDNLQRRTYKAIDTLISFMDKNFDAWKSSDTFKETHKLFIRNKEDFASAYVIDSRLLFIKLIPGLIQCQKREILPRIGVDLYNSLVDKRQHFAKDPQSTSVPAITEQESVLIDYIKEATAYYALHWGLLRLQVNMFPEGILHSVRSEQRVIKATKVPEVPIIDQLSKIYKADCNNALHKIEEFIKLLKPPTTETLTQQEINEKQYGFGEEDVFVTS